MTDLLGLKPLRDWQAKAVPPFAVPEYEDFTPMVQWMEQARDELEALASLEARLEAARRAIDDAIGALSIEMWAGVDGDDMSRVATLEASIAAELDRIDRAIGGTGQSIFANLSHSITQAMIALFEAKNALATQENADAA